MNRLKANSGSPAFESLEYLGQSTFTDTYFDDPVSTLSRQGVWVRQRGGTGWQAKIRQGGDYTNSQFHELSCPDEIGRIIKSYNIQYSPTLTTSSSSSSSSAGYESESESASASDKASFGLKRMAQFTTIREAWRANKEFKIVLDRTDFGHAVGEVELEVEVEVESKSKCNENNNNHNHHDENERQKGMTTQMDRQIETFMQDHSWAFPDGKVVGKLSAYFDFIQKKQK